MTVAEFRRLALSMPEASENAHMGHPDFRVDGKIFATLQPDKGLGMVKLTPEQQRGFVLAEPDSFTPVQGAWGRQGCTYVRLAKCNAGTLTEAMKLAWSERKAKPKLKHKTSAKRIPKK